MTPLLLGRRPGGAKQERHHLTVCAKRCSTGLPFGSLHFARPPAERNGKHVERNGKHSGL